MSRINCYGMLEPLSLLFDYLILNCYSSLLKVNRMLSDTKLAGLLADLSSSLGGFYLWRLHSRSCQVECLDGETEIVPLSYHLGHDIQIQFGREEFCLLTGLRFRVDYCDVYEEGLIPFRRRVFDSAKDGKPITGQMLEAKINSKDFKVSNDRDDWDMYPWGSYVWLTLYYQLRNANVKRWQPLYATKQEEGDDDHNSYSLMGFTWTFKGRRPTPTLTPDDYEVRSDWWVSSRGYFDGRIRKPARISLPVNQHTEDDVPVDLYRRLEEQDRVLKELLQKDSAREQMYNKMNKFMEELQVGMMPQAKK
ncbi:hypothetical protein Tco_0168495 [Tanacetum coccineum]